jgi:hypothetical protein
MVKNDNLFLFILLMVFQNNDNLFNDIISIHNEQIDEYKKQITILNALIMKTIQNNNYE